MAELVTSAKQKKKKSIKRMLVRCHFRSIKRVPNAIRHEYIIVF